MTSVREAARSLARTPIFTIVSILSVGIGIGLATSVFAVAHAIFFAPSPYPNPDRLVQIWQTQRPGSHQKSDYLLPERMQEWIHTPMRYLTGVSGYGLTLGMVLEGPGGAQRVSVQPIVGDWFGTLGTPATLGRVLALEDERPGAEPAAVVSWDLWRNRLGGGSDVLGRVLRTTEATYTVVGVMPRSFAAGDRIWIPAARLPAAKRPPVYLGFARLRPGATQEQARREIEQRSAAQVAADSARWGGFGATSVPMTEAERGGNGPTLWILAGVVAAVLLIGLSNLTTLFLVRAQERSATLAVRASLGARTWQLGRGLFFEALLVGVGGSILGILLAVWGGAAAASIVSTATPSLGLPSVLAAVALGVLVTVVVGVEPLRRLRLLDVRDLLQRRAAGSASTRGERRTRNAMVAAQVATCVALLAVLGLFGAMFRAYRDIDPGYDAARLVRAGPDYEAAGMERTAQWTLARRVAERVRRDPSVSGVALWSKMTGAWPPRPEHDPVIEGSDGRAAKIGSPYRIDPGFFRAMGIPVLAGRAFTDADDADSPDVIIVSKDGADVWWPGENPLGHQIKFGRDAPWMTVVGVVRPVSMIGQASRSNVVHLRGLHWVTVASVFVPARQWTELPPAWRETADCDECVGVSIAVRASGDPARAGRALHGALATLAPDLPLSFLETIYDQQMHSWVADRIIPPGRLVAAGSIVGLLLALLGIVGVVADAVARRTREIGVRMALGARHAQVLGAVARESLLAGAVGLGCGLLAVVLLRGLILKAFVDPQIRVITPSLLDPRLILTTVGVVLTVVLAASLLTARRALRVDPAEALRSD